ncbi:peptidase inhibitor 16-like [Dendropsophus ebraccatus]|uniref:peptidase inhibitor 16-like n=1 Tax=Dendropsophus ebraccatus TaxID=150705 RepID=UPI003831B8A7
MQGPHYLLLCLVHLITALTDEEKKTIVEKHNFYRSRPDPSATDMKSLRWDKSLEDLATSYAAKCMWEHNEERGFRGENLFLMSGSGLDVELGLDDWHQERDFYNFTTNTCQEGKMCGHYTQMVWADTERVGCGEKFCEKVEGFEDANMFLLVCNYEPPGNFQGEKPYKPGDPCSSCPPSHICRESLCIDESLEQEGSSTAQPGTTLSYILTSDVPTVLQESTQPELVPESTQPELTPEPTQPELTPEPTQPELTPEPTQPELTPEPTQPELTPEPTQPELTPEPTQPELTPGPTQPELVPESPQPELVPESTQPERTPEPPQPERTPEPPQPERTPEPPQPELTPEPQQPELTPEPTQPEQTPEPTQPERTPEPKQPELTPEPTQPELTPEPTLSGHDSKSTQSETVSKATWSELDPQVTPGLVPKATPSEQLLDSTQTGTEPLEVSTTQRKEHSTSDVIEQKSIQPTSQLSPFPSQETLSATAKPPLPIDTIPHTDKNGIDKAFSNDQPDAPTEKEAIIPVTVSAIPTKPARTPEMSVLVSKPTISQDPKRGKVTVKPPLKTPLEKKQKDMNLTSFKLKKPLSSSTRWDYKWGLSAQTHFGRPVHSQHFVGAPKPCPHPCLRSQSTPPLAFPLYRSNHILPWEGYGQQSQWVSKPHVKPSFKQLCKLLGYKRGVYSLYLPKAQQH